MWSKESGITLIELLTTLVIIGLLCTVAIGLGPKILEDYRLDKDARLLVSNLRETREKAMTENIWHELKFYPSINAYRIMRAGQMLEEVHFEQGVTLASDYTDLMFYPTGTPSVGTTIILSTKHGKLLKVILAPVTGRVRIE